MVGFAVWLYWETRGLKNIIKSVLRVQYGRTKNSDIHGGVNVTVQFVYFADREQAVRGARCCNLPSSEFVPRAFKFEMYEAIYAL